MTSRLTEEELVHALDLVKSGAGHHASGFVHEMIDELRAARARLAELELSEEDREALRFVLTLLAHNESGLTWLVDSTAVDHRMRCREAVAVINRLTRRGDK